MILELAATLALSAAPSQTTASDCAYHRSETRPPPYIRVLLKDGRTVWVDFKLYVARVTSSEWGSTPTTLRQAGALAVRQYGWRHVSRWSGQSWNGRCFHVYGWSRDQIYHHGKIPSDQAKSAASWASRHTLRNRETGTLLFTSYRAGWRKACASDAGDRLFARSATRCAWAGWGSERILTTYYRERKAVLRG